MENSYLNNDTYLFTEEDWKKCKSRAELPCKCKHCGKEVMQTKKRIQDRLNHRHW